MADRPAPARRAAHDRGLVAEDRAAAFLEGAGFTILARRARTPAGEIDLVARQEGLLVFCEVKARGGRDAAAYSLLPRQMRRIAAAAEAWLAARPDLATLDARFDAVLVSGDGVEHIPGAFEMEG
ncbi:YraN family protein [Aquabacter cavernae]|uniref:YraN family protein n=1 Tax=Aquabacter cavernae TaxID=2496029 RepID=UPI000F8D7D3A|nr:YraN family protein [Aquabacter cavernae]